MSFVPSFGFASFTPSLWSYSWWYQVLSQENPTNLVNWCPVSWNSPKTVLSSTHYMVTFKLRMKHGFLGQTRVQRQHDLLSCKRTLIAYVGNIFLSLVDIAGNLRVPKRLSYSIKPGTCIITFYANKWWTLESYDTISQAIKGLLL